MQNATDAFGLRQTATDAKGLPQCPKCQRENPAEAKFCMECGAKLENVCPKCGTKLPQEAKFCMECGAKVSEVEAKEVRSPSDTVPKLEDMHAQLQSLIPDVLAQKYLDAEQQATGENRLITALFADISGFTALSAAQSSEAIFQLVQDCFKQLVSVVASYEGSISGFRGDGLLALFGAPILHENDAERATLAAIDMRNTMQNQQLEVSIGVNTALMTVGEIQTQLHSEYTAYGTDINLAKRLQEAAKPGQILVGAGTHRLTRRAFEFETLSSLNLKGFPQAMTAYAVKHTKTHPEKLRGIEGLKARMIGREKEFDALVASAEEWLTGKGQILSIIGEAGIGKSRLVTELKAYLERQKEARGQKGQEDKLLRLEGRCISIGQPISYWPFLDILRSWFGLSEEDSEVEKPQKVRNHVETLLPEQSDDILPFLGYLMNLRFGGELDTRLTHYSSEQIQHRTMMCLRDLLIALARQERLLLVLEDLHWADDLSLDLLSLLMDELMAHPLMLVCVYRPEQGHRVWRLGSMAQRKCLERYTELSLQKLHPRESRRLVEELLAIDDLPESVRGMILQKSEGNPFFIEEVIRSLIEQGLVYREGERWKAKEEVVELEVPDTIQSVVLARVDRLEAEAKYVLQCASVIGRLFKHRLLEHLTQKQQELDQHITALEERDLVYEERTIPELEYAFKHALTQEATYQGILGRRRQAFHREVAQGIERLYQERIEDFYEELAYHWGRSGEQEKTLEYLMKAGKKAAKHYLNEAAIDYYTRALQLAEEMRVPGDRLAEIYEARGWVHNGITFYEECISDMLEAVRLCTQRSKRANMYQAISNTYAWSINDMDEAARYARKTLEEIEPTDKSWETASAYEGAATPLIHINLEEGVCLLKRAIAISEEMGYKDLLAIQYTNLGWTYYYMYPGEFKEQCRVARERAHFYLPHLKPNLSLYAWRCAVLANITGGDEYMHLNCEALECGIKSGSSHASVMAALGLGSVYRYQGNIQEAIDVYEQGWQVGVRARYIPADCIIRLSRELISLYASRGEKSKLLEIMLQMVDSTLVLHRKPEVYPTVQRRWNNTVEEVYEVLHTIAPEVYRELEYSLEFCLNTVDTDGARFFYRGQLMLLAMIDGRWKDAEAHTQELLKLRPHAGNFARRISQKVEYAVELMSVPPEQRQTVAANLLKSSDRFEDFRELLDAVDWVLPEDVIARLVGWGHLNGLALDYLQKQRGFDFLSWVAVAQLYERYGHGNNLQTLVERLQQTMADALQEEGITQLLLEPVELETGPARFIEQFTQEPIDAGWEWVNPVGDCSYEIENESYLQITVPPGHDLRLKDRDAPRLLRAISDDFTIETKISDGSEGKKLGGLFVWKDESNFARFEVASSSTTWWHEGCVYYEANVDGRFIHPGVHPSEADEVWLRLERKGGRFTGYVSADGENWYRCGWADISMEDPIQVGIHALCPGPPVTSTRFDYVKIFREKE